MAYIPLLLLCVVLFELFAALGVAGDAMAIITRSNDAMLVLRSPEFGDDEKEVHMRRASLEIFKATLRFALKFLAIALILYVLFVLMTMLFPALRDSMLERLFSLVAIAILTAATMCYAWIRKALLVWRRKA